MAEQPLTDMERIRRGSFKAGIFDIETTGLDADYDELICACIKTVNPNGYDGPIWTVRVDDRRNPNKTTDKWAVKTLIKEMNTYDLLIGWFSSGFDFPFINAKALEHGLVPAEKKFRRDLCYVSRGNLRLASYKLMNVKKFIFGSTDKTFLTGALKRAAIRRERSAIDFYVHHCRVDVAETEQVYKAFMPLLGKLRRGG